MNSLSPVLVVSLMFSVSGIPAIRACTSPEIFLKVSMLSPTMESDIGASLGGPSLSSLMVILA